MSETPPEPPAAPQVGPLATEAALLLDVVADRLESMKETTAAGAQAAPAEDAGRCPECGSVQGAAPCTACPLCRFMALMRGERPEATARLVDGALMIVRTLRSMVPDPAAQPGTASSQPQPGAQPPAPHPPHPATPHPPTRRGGLEHIDIS
jgi:hypothetical protein